MAEYNYPKFSFSLGQPEWSDGCGTGPSLAPGSGVRTGVPRWENPRAPDMEEKRDAAKRLAAEEPMCRTLLIDDLEGTVHRTYGAAWDAAYVCFFRSLASGCCGKRRRWIHR